MLKIKYTIVIPGAKKKGITFKDGLGPGVIAEQVVTYPDMDPDEPTVHDGLAIVREGERLRDETVKIEVEDIE